MGDPKPKTIRDVIAQLEELYERLPQIECQGLCWNTCGPIAASLAERWRIAQHGIDIPAYSYERSERWNRGEPLHCPALDQHRRCSVYNIRPMICRLWGLGRGQLACPYGCKPSGPRLRYEEVMELLHESMVIGGDDPGQHVEEGFDPAVMRDPEVTALLRRWIAGDRSVAGELQVAADRAYKRLEQERKSHG